MNLDDDTQLKRAIILAFNLGRRSTDKRSAAQVADAIGARSWRAGHKRVLVAAFEVGHFNRSIRGDK